MTIDCPPLAFCLFLGIFCAPGIALAADTTAPSTSPTTAPTTGPATEVVRRGDLSLTFDIPGYLEPVDSFEARYRPKVFAGELTLVSIAPDGATVKAGDVLLELDNKQLQKQVTAAENDVQAGAANLAKAEADAKLAEDESALELRQQQDAVKKADDTAKWFETVDGPQMLTRIQLGVKQAQAIVDDQNDELDQLRKMYKSEELTNATADIVVKRAVRSLEQAKIQLEMTKQRADENTKEEYPAARQKVADELTSAKFALQQLQIAQTAARVTRDSGLVASRASFAAAQQHLAELKQDLEAMTINAPFAGRVAWGAFTKGSFSVDPRALRAGEKIAAQQVVLTLLAPQKLRATGELPEARAIELPAQAPASVLPAAFPELRIAGTCDAGTRLPISSQAGAVYPMLVNLSAVDPRLAPGLRVTIHVDVPLAKNVLLVPVSAAAGGEVVVRDSAGKLDKRKVVTGASDGAHIVVESGLSEGDAVVLHPEP